MTDNAAKLAEFLVDQGGADIREEDLIAVIDGMFPHISDEEFLRGFAIAEETLISDINAAVAASSKQEDIKKMMEDYQRMRDGGGLG